MRAIIVGIFCVGMGTEAFAQQNCASILDRATASVNEREVRSTDVNDWMSEMCSSANIRNSDRTSMSFSYAAIGLDSSRSKKSISLNELCQKWQSSERGTFVERVYSQNIQVGFFAAYDTCVNAESPFVYVLENGNEMRTAIVSISSRDRPIKYSISIDGLGASDVKCSPHGTNKDIKDIDFSEALLEQTGFQFTCNHSPEAESADGTRVYSPAVVSIATDAYERGKKVIIIPFSGSIYVVGESLKKLTSEINHLRKKTNVLSEKDMSTDREIASINSNNTINLSRPISVLRVYEEGIFNTRYYLEFDMAQVDEILCREDWNDQVLSLVNHRNGLIDYVELSRTSNRGGILSNTWKENRINDISRDWRAGDAFSFLIPNNREQCQSSQ